jgi:glycosyltransferase involved in cell wall biosynthesis
MAKGAARDALQEAPAAGLRILVVANGWPSPLHPEYCVFNKRQMDEVTRLGARCEVLFVNARDNGKGAYLSALASLRRMGSGHDLVHCFHGLSFLLAQAARVRSPMVVSFLNAIQHEFADMPRPLRGLAEAATWRLARQGGRGLIFKDAVPPALAGDPLARHVANGVDLDDFRPGDRAAARRALGLDADAAYLLFVSSKNLDRPQKRHDRFVAALERLRALRPDLDLRPLTLVDSPAPMVRLAYHAADLHLMTSDYEGSPNSVKEALASGLRVVSTDVGNVREMIAGLPGCEVAPSATPDALAEAAARALATPPPAADILRARLLERGLDRETAARQVVRLYRDVLAARAAPPG